MRTTDVPTTKAITCRQCGEIPTIATGAPVFVTISATGVATIGVDLAELVAGLQEGEAKCGCDPNAPDIDQFDRLYLGALQEVADNVAPEVDWTLQIVGPA